MAFPFEHTKRGQAAGDVMQLRPLRTGLTAAQAELILTHPEPLFDVRVATHKTIDLVCQTEVYKLKRARRTPSGA
jgi:hypothetical protein